MRLGVLFSQKYHPYQQLNKQGHLHNCPYTLNNPYEILAGETNSCRDKSKRTITSPAWSLYAGFLPVRFVVFCNQPIVAAQFFKKIILTYNVKDTHFTVMHKPTYSPSLSGQDLGSNHKPLTLRMSLASFLSGD